MRSVFCLLSLFAACEPLALDATDGGVDRPDAASVNRPADDFDRQLEALRARYGVASIAIATIRDRRPQLARAAGTAAPGRAARVDTLYSLASCSKPIVGLAAAKLFELRPDLSLDTDIRGLIGWPLAHPDHPNAPITFRHLLTHTGGLESDSDADYETYPKPDPDEALGPWLRTLLAEDDAWLESAPGAEEEYSNVGVALLAHAIEVASGTEFRAFTRQHLFDPLGLADTRWFYGDLSASQQARHAIPMEADGTPYAIYGFNDYPSGLLRSTVGDLTTLLIMLMNGGEHGGRRILSAQSMTRFAQTPMLIEAYGDDDGVQRFEHSGGEAGVNTYLTWRADGSGYVYLINSDLSDAQLDAIHEDLEALLLDAAR